MAKSFNDLAYDLRDFIVDKHANYRGLKHMSMQRYNNLTISMNSRRYGQPHVIVKIGISEGVFSFPYVNKMDGRPWNGRTLRYAMGCNDMVNSSLNEHWKTSNFRKWIRTTNNYFFLTIAFDRRFL